MLDNDPNNPFFVWGRSPANRDEYVRLATNKAWIDSLEADQFSAALAQYAGHVLGYITLREGRDFTPVKQSSGLISAHALFRGLKRNLIDHDHDKRRYAYILNPVRDYGYEESTSAQRGHIKRPKPLDSVFAVYVEFGEQAELAARDWYGDNMPEDVGGVVHKWEWLTPLDPSDETLPVNFAARYEERLWQ